MYIINYTILIYILNKYREGTYTENNTENTGRIMR